MATATGFKTLALTSPHKKGDVVKDAQAVLHKNRFGQSFYSGPEDGDFGPLTAAASYRAHYWAGYPLKDCKPIFGELLRSYLVPMRTRGAKKLPLSFKLRRIARRHAKKPITTPGQKAIKLATSFLGVKESPPNSNDTMFGAWYGENGNPWCAMFVSYVLTKIGIKFHYAYVPSVVADARAARNGLFVTASPKEGDLVCYDWNNDGVFDHIGMFKSWGTARITGKFNTIEGNTSSTDSGDQSNGGEVCAKTRGVKDGYHVVFVRVKGM